MTNDEEKLRERMEGYMAREDLKKEVEHIKEKEKLKDELKQFFRNFEFKLSEICHNFDCKSVSYPGNGYILFDFYLRNYAYPKLSDSEIREKSITYAKIQTEMLHKTELE